MTNKNTNLRTFEISDEEQMKALGVSLSAAISAPCQVNLNGNLGAGKTTFARGFIQGLDYKGSVKSPTYTLIEPYELEKYDIYHIDLYRLSDPEELEFLGIREMTERNSVLLVEWPELGAGVLPEPDLVLDIEYAGEGRVVGMTPVSYKGAEVLAQLKFVES